MAKQKSQAPKEPTSYELLGMRIQRVINNPRSQVAKSALLERSANDSPEDWDQMLAEIAENDLAVSLKSGHVRAAALDVHEHEPFDPNVLGRHLFLPPGVPLSSSCLSIHPSSLTLPSRVLSPQHQ